MRTLLRAFHRDRSGVAATEFALITPAIALLAAASFAIWQFGESRQEMRSALEVGAHYYMNGGSDDAVATALAQSSWRNKPQAGVVMTTRACRCGEVVAPCANLCPASRPPAVYVTLTATAPLHRDGREVTDRTVVRVR
ncbi:pilus assembly protein [Phenylobacterium sp. LH3H17]|uniref:TadE/TadG family type IV pilus assembly protein n=1 Tax=Phenylobacterium sp. LH3H17 TaxID=2903901 RepID=UPI0020C9A5DF|nr:TadE/TadG family type IV pilus assembly protein [Phenylobacterium sp. LH3H17]UTP40609.1 pilus assembly protein [Phenylobacterium sp. LH3H17]